MQKNTSGVCVCVCLWFYGPSTAKVIRTQKNTSELQNRTILPYDIKIPKQKCKYSKFFSLICILYQNIIVVSG